MAPENPKNLLSSDHEAQREDTEVLLEDEKIKKILDEIDARIS